MKGYEKRQITIDFLKHIATLSVANIAVIMTFLSQLKGLEQAKTILFITVISFLLSVVFTIVSIFSLIGEIENLPKIHGTQKHNFLRFSFFISIIGFLVGVILLTVLIITNLV